MLRIVFTIAALFLSVFPLSVQAQQTSDASAMLIKYSGKLVSAYGIVLMEVKSADTDQTASVRTRKATLEQLDENTWRAVVFVREEDYRPNTKFTVVAKTEASSVVTSTVKWLTTPQAAKAAIAAKCRSLDDLSKIRKLIALSENDLRKVLKIREQKISLLKSQLTAALEPSVLLTLNKLEDALNLKRDSPITAEMSVEELATRVGAIAAVAIN